MTLLPPPVIFNLPYEASITDVCITDVCEKTMIAKNRSRAKAAQLLTLRFEIPEAAQILRISRALLYNRIQDGAIRSQKDGSRAYITQAELERYVESCNALTRRAAARASRRTVARYAKTTPRS